VHLTDKDCCKTKISQAHSQLQVSVVSVKVLSGGREE
jgi:hypothetical protein